MTMPGVCVLTVGTERWPGAESSRLKAAWSKPSKQESGEHSGD